MDRLYDKLIEMDPKSWSRAQKIIRKYAQSQALKSDLVDSTPKNQGHVVMALSGLSGSPTPRPSSQSPEKQRKNMAPIQGGETKPEEGRPRAVGGTARTLATVGYAGTVTR